MKRDIKINEKFGDFKVISSVFVENGMRKVTCECKCGTQTKIACCNIKRSTKCKACSKKERHRKYKIGDKYNDFEIVAYEERKDNKSYLRCKCKCGNFITCTSSTLKKTIACQECYYKRRGSTHHAYKGSKNIYLTYFTKIKLRANSKKIDFNIDIEYIDQLFEMQNKLCAISKLPISFERSQKQTASLDRIDSSKGYVRGNVQWLHKDINKMKWDFTQEKLFHLCKLVYENNKNE